MSPGYILTTAYMQIGITEESAEGFNIIQLVRPAPNYDWFALKVRVQIPSANISFDVGRHWDKSCHRASTPQSGSAVDEPASGEKMIRGLSFQRSI
jgi:hypothetical protein